MTFKINQTNETLRHAIISEPTHNDVAQIRLRETYRENLYGAEGLGNIHIDMLELRAPNQFTSPRDAERFWAHCGITIRGEIDEYGIGSGVSVNITHSSGGASNFKQARQHAKRYEYALLLMREIHDRLNGLTENAAYTPLDRFEIVEG